MCVCVCVRACVRACVCVCIYLRTKPETIRFVKHLQLMSSLHFRLGDAESFVNDLFMFYTTGFEYFVVCTAM